jgi:hypothetical protein
MQNSQLEQVWPFKLAAVHEHASLVEEDDDDEADDAEEEDDDAADAK